MFILASSAPITEGSSVPTYTVVALQNLRISARCVSIVSSDGVHMSCTTKRESQKQRRSVHMSRATKRESQRQRRGATKRESQRQRRGVTKRES